MNVQYHFRLSASQQAILIYLKAVGGRCSASECVRRTRGVHGYLNDLRFMQYVAWDDPLTIDTTVELTSQGHNFLQQQFPTAPDDFDQMAQIIVPMFRGKDLAFEKDLVFVVMPFANDFFSVYTTIKDAVNRCGKICERADDIFSTQPIIETVWERLNKAAIVICDLSCKNANVFYETGVSHTLGKDVILIAQAEEDIPFDLRSLPNYKYDTSDSGLAKLADDLVLVITEIIGRRTKLRT